MVAIKAAANFPLWANIRQSVSLLPREPSRPPPLQAPSHQVKSFLRLARPRGEHGGGGRKEGGGGQAKSITPLAGAFRGVASNRRGWEWQWPPKGQSETPETQRSPTHPPPPPPRQEGIITREWPKTAGIRTRITKRQERGCGRCHFHSLDRPNQRVNHCLQLSRCLAHAKAHLTVE
jgi:hypothetical protein